MSPKDRCADGDDLSRLPAPDPMARADAAEGHGFAARLERRWLIVLLVLLAVAAAFRLQHAWAKYPSLDEQWHLNLSTGRGSFVDLFPEQVLSVPPPVTSTVGAPSPWAVWTHLQGVMHPPLYVTSLRLWRELFGDGDAVAVSFSVLCSLLALAGCFLAARLSFGVLPAALAGSLMAVSPSQSWFGVQIRGYAMLLALASGLLLAVVKVDRQGWTRLRGAVIAVLMLALMLTHYFAAGVCAVVAIGLLATLRGRPRREFLLALVVIAVVYLAIWGPFLRQQLADVGPMADAWLVDPRQPLSLSLLLFAAFPARAVADLAAAPGTLAFAGVLYAAAIAAASVRPRYRVWTAWLLATPLMLLCLDLARHSVHLQLLRYSTASTLAVYVLFAVLLASVSRWLAVGIATPVILVTAYFGTAPDLGGSPRFGGIIDTIVRAPEDRDRPPIVFVNDGGPPWHARGMMMEATHNPHTRGRAIAWVESAADAELMQQLTGRSFWAAGVRGARAPESTFPWARPRIGYVIGACYALSMGPAR